LVKGHPEGPKKTDKRSGRVGEALEGEKNGREKEGGLL